MISKNLCKIVKNEIIFIDSIVIKWIGGNSSVEIDINSILKTIRKYTVLNIVDLIQLQQKMKIFYEDNLRLMFHISKMSFHSMLYEIEEIFNEILCRYNYYIKLGSKNIKL